jgi:hypothetical protein
MPRKGKPKVPVAEDYAFEIGDKVRHKESGRIGHVKLRKKVKKRLMQGEAPLEDFYTLESIAGNAFAGCFKDEIEKV